MTLSPDKPPSGTLRDWIEKRANGEGTAFVFPEGEDSLSWANLRDTAARIARGLTAQGIARGESVAIMMPNGRAAVQCLMGVLYGGFRATMINLVAGQEAISYALDHSESRFAFVDDSQIDLFHQASGGRITRLDPDADASISLHPVLPRIMRF